jgi:hypothetical protein
MKTITKALWIADRGLESDSCVSATGRFGSPPKLSPTWPPPPPPKLPPPPKPPLWPPLAKPSVTATPVKRIATTPAVIILLRDIECSFRRAPRACFVVLVPIDALQFGSPNIECFLTRYDSVVRALKDTSAFSSASGVMMNEEMNQVLRGNTLCSDGEDHRRFRRLIAKPLTPTALNSLKAEIAEKAEALLDRLVAKGSFCARTEQMFNCFGPMNERTRAAFSVLEK